MSDDNSLVGVWCNCADCKAGDPVPYGTCHCRCRRMTPIAKMTNRRLGHIAGFPTPYARGHNSRTFSGVVQDRFWSHAAQQPVDPHSCWEWLGPFHDGYGLFRVIKKRVKAHCFAYELTHGLVPEGTELHHKCGNRKCIRLDHLEVVTRIEHMTADERIERLRARNAAAAATRCRNGHRRTVENTYIDKKGRRNCQICADAAGRPYPKR